MRAWTDPHPTRPSPVAAAIIAVLAILVGVIIAFAGRAGAAPVRCGGPCPTYPTTTQATTTTAPTTTVKPTTTTAPVFSVPPTGPGGCLQCFPTTVATTVAPTTLPPATTAPPASQPPTTAAPTTAAPTTAAPAAPAAPAAASSQGETLPVTGANPWWLALFGVCLLALGYLASAFAKRTAR